MADAVYDLAKEKFLRGEISWNSDDIKAVLVDVADYTVNTATDEFLDDIPAGARVATSANMTGKTTTAGAAGVDDFAFGTVTGDEAEAVVFYKDTGTEGTSPLIVYRDTATSGLPVTPNGGDVNISFATTVFAFSS